MGYSLSVKIVPFILVDLNIMGILILIGSIDYPEKYDLYLLTEQLQQVQST